MTGSLTLVLVDDELAHARLFERTLRRAGVRNPILHLKDGADALAWLAKPARPEPLLLVLDLSMPRVDGYQVLERLQRDRSIPPVPLLVLTTTQEARDVEQCRRLGCTTFLSKPVDMEKFIAATKRLGLFLDVTTEAGAWGRA
jgi:CheY-like chemotaxis protein